MTFITLASRACETPAFFIIYYVDNRQGWYKDVSSSNLSVSWETMKTATFAATAYLYGMTCIDAKVLLSIGLFLDRIDETIPTADAAKMLKQLYYSTNKWADTIEVTGACHVETKISDGSYISRPGAIGLSSEYLEAAMQDKSIPREARRTLAGVCAGLRGPKIIMALRKTITALYAPIITDEAKFIPCEAVRDLKTDRGFKSILAVCLDAPEEAESLLMDTLEWKQASYMRLLTIIGTENSDNLMSRRGRESVHEAEMLLNLAELSKSECAKSELIEYASQICEVHTLEEKLGIAVFGPIERFH